MIHSYHIILPMYGFWLPNDPRGSWSQFIRKWELVRFGRTTRTNERRDFSELSEIELRNRSLAREQLSFPPVSVSGQQAAAIGRGFANQVEKSQYTVWACSILPEHTHLVIARHCYRAEQIANLLKGAATRQLVNDRLHPLMLHAEPGKRPPRMWASRQWKVYLDCEESIEDAIQYVEDNPSKEGKPRQLWNFVTAFAGLPKGGWVTYHGSDAGNR